MFVRTTKYIKTLKKITYRNYIYVYTTKKFKLKHFLKINLPKIY